MRKFLLFNGKEKTETQYEYHIGEVITVNSHTPMKCREKQVINGELIHFFVSGRVVFD